MKLSSMIMILIIIQATIIMYDAVYDVDDYEMTSYGDNSTKVWGFVSNPGAWNDTALIVALVTLGVGVGAFIVVGTFLNTPSDVAIFSPVFVLLVAAGAIPILSLYNVFTRNVTMFGCTAMPCAPATWAWILTGGIIAVFYILSVLEWWSGRSTG